MQAIIVEREVRASGDDDVVEHPDIHQAARIGYTLSELPILEAWFQSARGVVVEEHDSAGFCQYYLSHEHFDVHNRSREASLSDSDGTDR